MKRLTKLGCVFLLLLSASVVSLSAATLRIPEGNSWYAVTGAKGKAYDAVANTALTYSTQGVVNTSGYGITVSVHQSNGYRVAYNSSVQVGVLTNANAITNTSAPYAHYHQIISAYGAMML